jgi:RNA polymerase sigma factor for flagellar operon FliA
MSYLKNKDRVEKGLSKKLHETSRIFQAQEKSKNKSCKVTQRTSWKKKTLSTQPSALSPQERDELIRKHVSLVNWIVNRLPINTIKGMEREDLIGYGIIGLIEAVDRFDPTRSTSFQSFATTRIKGAIYDQLRVCDWLSRGARKRVKNLIKATQILESRLSRYPTDKELANELVISLEELRTIQQEAQIGIFSLDEPRDSSQEESTTLVDNVSSHAAPILDELEENELKERLAKAINTLPEREKTVIGLYHYKKLTFKEIAEVMDFSESRASQVHARAISLLKSKMLKD